MADLGKTIERFFESPAHLLDEGIVVAKKEETVLFNKKPLKLAGEYFHSLGPGLVTGAADDDPSSIATYSQAGARYGFGLLWLSLFTFPFMAVVQEMCARIGIVTGRGMAANIRRHYSRRALFVVCTLLFVANTFTIAADLGAMAASMQLLMPHLNPALLVIAFAVVTILLQIFMDYAHYARYLKWLVLALFSYVFTALAIDLNWGQVLWHTVVPTLEFTRDEVLLVCAVLGATLSPYLFFWQTAQEVEEEKYGANAPKELTHDPAVVQQNISRMRVDVWSGMFFSNLIMFFIMVTCAATLFASGITTITTPYEAALAIRPFGGEATFFIFALGIIGTGLLAVPILAGSSAYAIAESFGWRRGLHNTLRQAHAFYGVIIVSMGIAVIANLAGFDPIKGLIYASLLNGLIAPILLFIIVRMSSRMRHFKNGPVITFLGWTITALMTLSALASLYILIS